MRSKACATLSINLTVNNMDGDRVRYRGASGVKLFLDRESLRQGEVIGSVYRNVDCFDRSRLDINWPEWNVD